MPTSIFSLPDDYLGGDTHIALRTMASGVSVWHMKLSPNALEYDQRLTQPDILMLMAVDFQRVATNLCW